MSPTTIERMAGRTEAIRTEAAEIIGRESDTHDHGFRYVDGTVSVGQSLESSAERDECGEAEYQLSGVSTFETLDEALRYAGWAAEGSIVLVRGQHAGWGSLAGEQLLADASVAAVWTI